MKWKTYIVAGFPFSLCMAEGHALWNGLDNYAPFEREYAAGTSLFTLEVVEALSVPEEKKPLLLKEEEDDMPVINVYGVRSGLFVELSPHRTIPPCAYLHLLPGWKTGRLQVLTPHLGTFALNNALMLLFTFNTATRGALEMHASVVTCGGRGYLFLGKSGTGKSTHSSLWLKYIPGTELLNDDNPVLRLCPDGTVRVYGSPWSGKTPCYKDAEAPVGAIVRIRQAPENRITRLPLVQAYASLFSSASAFRPLRELADGWHHTLEELASTVPCYVLDCLPDEGAALLCNQTVTAHG